MLKKVDGEFVEAMDIRIGGRLGPDPRFGDVVLKKVPHWELDETLLRIFSLYETTTTRARRSATSRAAPQPEWWTEQLDAARRSRPDLDAPRRWSPDAVERFHPRVALACSFQKEETGAPRPAVRGRAAARACSRSTPRVLFDETYDYWRRVEERYGTRGRGVRRRADPPDGGCGRPTPRPAAASARSRRSTQALSGLDAWITGMRREQSPTRSDIDELGWDAKHGLWKFNPLADWTERDVWAYIADHGLPSTRCTTAGYASIGCVHCTQPGSGREGRWAGSEKTECGLHV